MDGRSPYEPVAQQINKEDEPERCTTRTDDAGAWNFLKTYSIFVAHLAACVLLVVSLMEWVDGRNFRPGTPPLSIFTVDGMLYQTQVNGLVSLALVFVRLLAACCTAPLVWTVILILLEQRGMTLPEISRFNNYTVPILPRSKAQDWRWYGWATLVTMLLWPPNFASPVANSSLAWIPNAFYLGANATLAINSHPENAGASFWSLRAPEWQMSSFLQAVVRTGASPAYAFNTTGSRRYFPRSQALAMTSNSVISAPVPHIDFKIRWIDGAHNDTLAKMITNTTLSDYVGKRENGVSRTNGSVVFMGDEPWDRNNDWPSSASKFNGERLVAVKVSEYNNNSRNKNGTVVTLDSECPEESSYFVSLPGFSRVLQHYSAEPTSWGRDCYQIGIVTMEAGLVQGKDCTTTLIGASEAAATCSFAPDTITLEDDWIAPIAVNMVP